MSNKAATLLINNIRVPHIIYHAVTPPIIITVLNMMYRRFIPWKKGIHQTTENCRVYKISGPDYLL